MLALRDAVKRQPPQRSHVAKLLQALDSNMALPSAYDFNDADKMKHMEQIMRLVPDFRAQWELHLESNRTDRSFQTLRQRLKHLIDRDAEEEQ